MNSSALSADAASQVPVGIDLGTTYSVVAHLDATGRPVTVPNGWGDLLTPSALLFDGEEVVIGKEAVKGSPLAPELYAECFKRDMGGPSYRHQIRGLEAPPEVLSALVLERLKKDAQSRLGPIRQAVITVPAFFDETRRKATQDAGRLAGLEVLDIINEPTAAALAYGYYRGFWRLADPGASSRPQRVLVYDLGGGTFDVTILEICGTRFRALATDGDVRLGGKDFDERLVNHLAERFRLAQGADPRADQQDAAQLWLDAQEAKHALSERSKTTVVCFHAGLRMRLEVARAEFEELTRDLVERTETTTSLVVGQAGLTWADIDRVLLVGGSSRMPMIREMLRKISGKDPDCSQSPDEAVAHGAALYAGMLIEHAATSGKPACELINVNSHSLGVAGIHEKTREKVNVILVPKNTPLPCRVVRNFKTAKAGQRSVKVSVVEGESHRPEDCIALGDCVVSDLPAGLPQGTPIEVEYSYAANGRLSVSARIPSIRVSTSVEIKPERMRNLEDLETWRMWLLGRAAGPAQGFAAAPATVDLKDRAAVLKRLDALYVKLGKAAAGLTLPEPLSRHRVAAAAAAAQCARAQAACQEAQRARHAPLGRADAIQLDARLAQAKAELQQVQVRSDFAHLVLGRECVAAGIQLAGAQCEIEEICRLRRHLGQ